MVPPFDALDPSVAVNDSEHRLERKFLLKMVLMPKISCLNLGMWGQEIRALYCDGLKREHN